MVSAALTFDRLAYVDRLKEAGFDEKQARAQAAALEMALQDTVAKKADVEEAKGELRQEIGEVRRELSEAKAELRQEISEVRHELTQAKAELRREIEDVRREIGEAKAELRRDLRDVEIRLDAKIDTMGATLKVEILRWLIVTQVALASFIFAAIKFMK